MKSSSIELSVVIPTYNDGFLLETALDSVISQSGPIPAMEIICVNDGSTSPESIEVLSRIESLDPRILVVNLDKNSGVSVARNEGAARARGEWLIFFDADDTWRPGSLGKVWEQIRLHPDAEWVTADWACCTKDRIIDPEGAALARDNFSARLLQAAYRENSTIRIERPMEAALRGGLSTPGACFIKCSLLERFGDYSTTLRYAEDFDMYQRYAPHTDMYFVPVILLNYLQWHKPDRGRLKPEGYWTAEALKRRLDEPEYRAYKKLIRDEINWNLRDDLYRFREKKNRMQALEAAFRLLYQYPLDRVGWRSIAAALLGR